MPAPRAVVAAVVTCGLLASACTGIRVREFARETYTPPSTLPPASRVFVAPRQRVWSELLGVVRERGGRIELHDPDAGVLEAALPWSAPGEARFAVSLGRVDRVVTRTTRHYRSWSPLHFRCNACVVRNGTVTDQQTEIVDQERVELDPGRYRIDLRLRAEIAPARSGVRLSLIPELQARPREPREIEAVSTGALESLLFDAIELRLGSLGSGLR